jgi:hypothetical protein
VSNDSRGQTLFSFIRQGIKDWVFIQHLLGYHLDGFKSSNVDRFFKVFIPRQRGQPP